MVEPQKTSKVKVITAFFVGIVTGVALVAGGGYAFMRYAENTIEANQPEWMPDFDEHTFKSAAQLQAARTAYERWIANGDLAIWLVDSGAIDRAEELANEALKEAENYPKDWNYGNALHKAHIALGRIAIRRNKIPEANKHLLKAGQVRGSPQLNTFGQNMILAKELLEKGEKEAVLKYFYLCRKFWEMGGTELDQWVSEVKTGKVPAFGPNLIY